MIHGLNIAHAILTIHAEFSKAQGQQWIITDGCVYMPPSDEPLRNKLLNAAFMLEAVEDRSPHTRWVHELMQEFGVRALPQNVEALGCTFDSRDFWSTSDLSPIKARVD